MPHTNRPYKSSYRYRRYCHFPRISSSFLLCAYIIAFFRCRFGKETSAAQYPPVRNLEALPLMRYNNCWQLFIPLDLSRFSPGLRPKPKNMAYDTAINFRRSMMKNRQRQKDTLFSILIFCSAFAVNLLIQKLFTTQTLVPMIFVFGVFRPLVYMLYICSILCLFYLGGMGHLNGVTFLGQTITGGTIVTFYMYIPNSSRPSRIWPSSSIGCSRRWPRRRRCSPSWTLRPKWWTPPTPSSWTR